MRRSNIIIIIAMAVVLAILLSLGTWQVQRLQWKEALIDRMNNRLDGAPVELSVIGRSSDAALEEIDYTPVTVTGSFLPDHAFFEFTTFKGQSGWNIFQPVKLSVSNESAGAEFIIVNRGFVPYEARESWQTIARTPEGNQTITGLLRVPPDEKPGSFMPDNEPQNAIYYWRDIKTMANAAGIAPQSLSPYYVDAGIPGRTDASPNSFPMAGTTIISFPNNHLQYAVTWYGLALALLGVGSYFLYARRKSNTASNTG